MEYAAKGSVYRAFRTTTMSLAISGFFALQSHSGPNPNAISEQPVAQGWIQQTIDTKTESILQTDGLMREYVGKRTKDYATSLGVAKMLFNDIRNYGDSAPTAVSVTANAKQTFYLKKGLCSQRSYLLISLFNERMKELGLNSEARLCEVYRNNSAFGTIPHVAVAVTERNNTTIFDPTLGKVTNLTDGQTTFNVLGKYGVLSNHLINLAGIADSNGDRLKAEEFARIATRLEPNSAIAHYVLAQYLSLNGKMSEARKEAETTVAIAPTWPNGYVILRSIFLKLGLKSEERVVWKQMVQILPKDSWDVNQFLKENGYSKD